MTIPGCQRLLLICLRSSLERKWWPGTSSIQEKKRQSCCHTPGCRGQKSLEPGVQGSKTQVSHGGEAGFGASPLLPHNRNSPHQTARAVSQLKSF